MIPPPSLEAVPPGDTMNDADWLVAPTIVPPLDPAFRPAVLAHRRYQEAVADAGGERLVLGLERSGGALSRFETRLLPEGHPLEAAGLEQLERILKFLLWQRGAWRVHVGGPRHAARHLRQTYDPNGARSFDWHFMGEDVYGQPFTVVECEAAEVPAAREASAPLGRHLEGCRIGFDPGASDRKVSAVVNGEVVFSEEVVWAPAQASDPAYHYEQIRAALLSARGHLPRLDAIGGSAAGVYVDNEARIASLFRGIPKERFAEVRTIFGRLREEFGVPLEIANDGDVTALAGAMSLEDTEVLGLALGSSLAAGYVNAEGNLTGWLNELAFAPFDLSPKAPIDEWSGDRGVGVSYLSQQCVFRLASVAGLPLPAEGPPAERLAAAQRDLEAGHERARLVFDTMGVYMGYAIAHCADFYPVKNILVLGRCTSGLGGSLILDAARRVLDAEFPELCRLNIQLPDEKSRRVGQSIAAASLPMSQV